jgi:hypothetical protein
MSEGDGEKVSVVSERRVDEDPKLEGMMHKIAGILDHYGRNITTAAFDAIEYSWSDPKSGIQVEFEYSVGYHTTFDYRTAMNMQVSYPRQEIERQGYPRLRQESIMFFDRQDHAVASMSVAYDKSVPVTEDIEQYSDLLNYVVENLPKSERSTQLHPQFEMSRISPTEFM